MKIDKRKTLRNIRNKWDNPEKLLDVLVDMEKQVNLELNTAYDKGYNEGRNETIYAYSVMFWYMLSLSGYGKKTLPLFMDNLNYVADQMAKGELNLEKMQERLKKYDINIKK